MRTLKAGDKQKKNASALQDVGTLQGTLTTQPNMQALLSIATSQLGSPLDVTASRLDADPKATSTGVDVMLCFMNGMFLAVTLVSLNSLMTLSSQAVARAEPSALNAMPPTWSVCPCNGCAAFGKVL